MAPTDENVDGITLVSRDPNLDHQRNPLPPVSRLPAEILANIFIRNARYSYVRQVTWDPNTVTLSWVNVSYVCRHWRDIALNCQTLWTYIPITSQRWTQELLARSKKAPLKICIKLDLDDECSDRLLPHVLPIVEQLMNHSQRIQELRVDFLELGVEFSYDILPKLLSSCLPCLQHLEISNIDVPDGDSSFPFEGNTPALRTLVLKDCCIPWKSLELGALTTLYLDSVGLPFPQTITMAEFLAMLYRMPHLVQLFVHNSLPSALSLSSGEFNAAPMINLSRLSNVSIEAPISTVNALLSCVDIPLITKVRLRCAGSLQSIGTHDDITRLVSLFAKRINPSYDPAPAVPTLRSLPVATNFTTTLAFSMFQYGFSFSSSEFPHRLDSDENNFLLVYMLDDGFFTPSDIFSRMSRSIPFTSIRSIHFFELTQPTLDFWRDMLALFPQVRYIKLNECCDMPNIASILSLPSHDCSGDKDGPVGGNQTEILVPELEELEFYSVTFSEVDSVSDLDTLCEAISTRKETRCRLSIKESCAMTARGWEDLELIGCWEDAQFKVIRL